MRVWTRSAASRFESGSSKRKSFGVRTMARPMATRWRWPPESSAGRRARSGSSESRRRGVGDALLDRRAGGAGLPEAERHVVLHRQVRIERVALEDHGDFAIGGGGGVDAPAVDQDVARGRVLEAGDDAEQRGLAAAGGADEDAELAVGDGEVDAPDDVGLAEGLGDGAEVELAHAVSCLMTWVASRRYEGAAARHAIHGGAAAAAGDGSKVSWSSTDRV